MTNLEKDYKDKFEIEDKEEGGDSKEDNLEDEGGVCGDESECCKGKSEKDSVIEAEELDYHQLYLQSKIDLEKIRNEFDEYKKNDERFKQELNDKFIKTIEKKSVEAAEIIKNKTAELESKYKEEFKLKKDFIYENQLIDLVGLISQFESILKIDAKSEEVKNYLMGFKMFLTQFKNLLSKFNIAEITPNLGDVFNSDEMMSVQTEEVAEKQKNKILKVYSSGFKLNGRIIKLSEVVVGI